MPLYFTDKKKRWPPSKPVQYILATIALLLAISLLVGWLLLRFVYTDEPGTKPSDATTTTSSTQMELPDAAYCVFIIEDKGYERFALIKLDPAGNRITVDAIPATLPINDQETLAKMYQRTKAAEIVRAISKHYQIPVEHYISLSIAELEKFILRWDGSLRMAPPEEMVYQDEKGKDRPLHTEVTAMTPQQIEAMLKNTHWKNESSGIGLAADVAAALFNQMLTPNRDLQKCFSSISAHSNLKIHHFTTYRKALDHLVSQNTGAIAQRGTLLTNK